MMERMRSSLFGLCVLCFVLVVTPSCKRIAAAVSFEGEIEMSMGGAGVGMTTLMTIKGDKIRTDMKGLMSYASITDMGAKKTWVLDTAAHTYTEMDLSKTPKPTTPPPAKSPAKVTKTGRTDKIAGYACDIYTIDDPTLAMHLEACSASGISLVAFGLSNPFGLLAPGQKGNDDMFTQLVSHGFPLRIAYLDASGAPLMKIEATRVEKKSVPDSDFAIPAGYTKTASPI
jgi:hypothetical protein